MKSHLWEYCFRITDPTGPTETSIAPRQRPKANSSTAASSVLTIQSSATPVKVQVPGVFGNRGQKGNVPTPKAWMKQMKQSFQVSFPQSFEDNLWNLKLSRYYFVKKAPYLHPFWMTLNVQVVGMQNILIYAGNCLIKRLQEQLNGKSQQSKELHV